MTDLEAIRERVTVGYVDANVVEDRKVLLALLDEAVELLTELVEGGIPAYLDAEDNARAFLTRLGRDQ